MKHFFITGTGTGVGKTLVTTALAWQLREQGKKVVALKPIITGFDASDSNSDSALIMQSSGASNIDTISPWRFAAPLAPSMAAACENKTIDFDSLMNFCQKQSADFVLVEGVGGVMSPITENKTVLDWMAALSWPAIVVAGSYLGSLSHTLTALEALRARKVPIVVIIVSESENSGVPLDDTIAALQPFTNIPLVKLPRLAVNTAMWKAVPPMLKILNA